MVGSFWPIVLDAIKQQTIYPDKLIVIDSGSKEHNGSVSLRPEKIYINI